MLHTIQYSKLPIHFSKFWVVIRIALHLAILVSLLVIPKKIANSALQLFISMFKRK